MDTLNNPNIDPSRSLPSCCDKRYVERFAELCDLTKKKFIIHNRQLWSTYNAIGVPYGPACEDYSLSETDAQMILRQLKVLLIRWGNGFNASHSGQWYAMTCDQFIPVGLILNKDCRHQIRKGIERIRLERVDAATIAKSGYNTYTACLRRYKNRTSRILTQKQFYEEHIVNASFEDIIHYWGAYRDNQLVGFSLNYVYDDIECMYHLLICHSDFLRFYLSEAMFYGMNAYYVGQNQVRYINGGLRNIYHATNVQDFLSRKLNFKKTPVGLSVCYQPAVDLGLKMSYPLRRIFGRMSDRLRTIYTLESIRRADEAVIAPSEQKEDG